MTYLPFDPRHETVAFLAASVVNDPVMAEVAAKLGCHVRIACRIVAEKMYANGTRTTSIGDGLRVMHSVDNPVGPVDDDPEPGSRADVAA
jgi:hypothetical protein